MDTMESLKRYLTEAAADWSGDMGCSLKYEQGRADSYQDILRWIEDNDS